MNSSSRRPAHTANDGSPGARRRGQGARVGLAGWSGAARHRARGGLRRAERAGARCRSQQLHRWPAPFPGGPRGRAGRRGSGGRLHVPGHRARCPLLRSEAALRRRTARHRHPGRRVRRRAHHRPHPRHHRRRRPRRPSRLGLLWSPSPPNTTSSWSRTPPARSAASFDGRPCGAFGDVAVFSLHARKGITSGEGGVVVTDDAGIAERVRRTSCFGMSSAFARQHSDRLEIPEFAEVGYNYKLSDILAAIALVQLGKLDGFMARRRALARALRHPAGRRTRDPRTQDPQRPRSDLADVCRHRGRGCRPRRRGARPARARDRLDHRHLRAAPRGGVRRARVTALDPRSSSGATSPCRCTPI